MKKISIAIVIFLFFSCSTDNCVEYIIENKTDKNLEIISLSNDSITKRREILANAHFIEMNVCSVHWGEVVRNDAIMYESDSIQVRTDGVLVKTYYPNDKGKSIFKNNASPYREEALDSWKIVEDRTDYRKYVFEITEEDLK